MVVNQQDLGDDDEVAVRRERRRGQATTSSTTPGSVYSPPYTGMTTEIRCGSSACPFSTTLHQRSDTWCRLASGQGPGREAAAESG